METHEYIVKGSKENLVTIEIPLEEYKALLMIKGRYEELKSQEENRQKINWNSAHIRDFSHQTQPIVMHTDESNDTAFKPVHRDICCD